MLIDTNILIAFLGGETVVVNLLTTLQKETKTLFLSPIVEAELLSYSVLSVTEVATLVVFLKENFVSLSINSSVAQMAASLRRNRAIKLPDALIAASALEIDVPLVTRNIKDFKNIADLQLLMI